MFIIDKTKNRIAKLEKKTFSELEFKEREHLQEWIANNPEALSEELLIIQKEFSGFNDTNERLDLLALDKQGNLVVIENKLDDSGKDVTWQVLKYASYCSTLTSKQIVKIYQDYLDKRDESEQAEASLSEFFDNNDYEEILINKGQTQRIVMVAGNYRKEVTSTVLWLMNYKLRIQCFKATPYALGDQLFLNIEQIIPMRDAEEYTISMAEKTQEDISSQEELKTRHSIRQEYWSQLLHQMNKHSTLFQNISPSKEGWIITGSGISGVGFECVATKTYTSVGLYIGRSNSDENKWIFHQLLKSKDEIEKEFGQELKWEELPDKKASRIKYELYDVNIFNKEDWSKMTDFLVENMITLENALKEPLKKVGKLLKSKDF